MTIVPNEGQSIVVNIPTSGGGGPTYTYTGTNDLDINNFLLQTDGLHSRIIEQTDTEEFVAELAADISILNNTMYEVKGFPY